MLVSPDDAEEVGARGCTIPTVKIIDFGLAKALNASVDPMRLTWGGLVGTPAFASPEQFENAAVDVRTDIYSLGATLWFALTGKTPFGGHSVEEIHRAQQSDALPIEQLKAAHVPHWLRSLLQSMLAAEPAARPNTRDLAVRLQRCDLRRVGWPPDGTVRSRRGQRHGRRDDGQVQQRYTPHPQREHGPNWTRGKGHHLSGLQPRIAS